MQFTDNRRPCKSRLQRWRFFFWDVLLKAIFAVADKLSIYAPDVLKAIIDEDEDMVGLMNLNVKLREAS